MKFEQLEYLNAFKKFTAYPRKIQRLHVVGIWCWAGPRGWIGPEW